ncbi:hypothetical protein GY45DRAFT_1357916 [Cubamyces sp. BRFM 1775]|nr:hypothetical protein GY45DRAFT_1357916 [Cubamyces sp. BRFM 1775]
MSGDEGEYEVAQLSGRTDIAAESILRAQVVSKRGKKQWLYCVKWKNYSHEDNTWEPIESFSGGSEHFVEHFWNRVDTNDRDYHILRHFSVGEEVFPSGPPRRKKAKKSKEEVHIPSPSSVIEIEDSENEVRSIIADEEEPEEPVASTTQGKRRRRSSAAADADANPSPPKRKRGRPPGRPAAEVEEEEAAKAITRKWSMLELPRTNRIRPPPAAESSATPARRPPLPRRRGRPPPENPQRPSSASPDELLIHPETNGKPSSSRGKGTAEVWLETSPRKRGEQTRYIDHGTTVASPMEVDDSEAEAPVFGAPALLAPAPVPESAPEAAATSTPVPAHRSRAANPRVKILDDPNLTGESSAISVKAKLMKRNATANHDSNAAASPARPARVSKGKAGPGKSSSGLIVGGSRLVAQKGKLTTVRSGAGVMKTRVLDDVDTANQNGNGTAGGPFLNFAQMDDVPGLGQADPPLPPAPQSPPSGKELLKEAGMDKRVADDLPDFEEDAEGEDDIEYLEQIPESTGVQQPNGEAAASKPVEAPVAATDQTPAEQAPEKPAIVLEAKPVTFASRVASAWSQSTIFGPLALGASPTRNALQNEPAESSVKRYTLNLNLDPAVSLPIVLEDAHTSTPFLEKLDSTARNPTGKFYKDQYALSLVDTLRPQGTYAKVRLDDGATEEQKRHFERFLSRLQAGELFIQMNSFEPLVMCASENSVLAQKLGVPGPLLGLASTAIVAHVGIEDHCAYAEAAVHADASRWSL